MTESHSGGCQCGAVRYRVDGPLDEAGACHCRMCQKAGGNFGLVFFSAPNLTFTRGEPAEFESSPGVWRGFCNRCGTPLYMRLDGGTHDMTIGSLDHPDDVGELKSQIGIESECRWFRDLAAVPRFETVAAYNGIEPGSIKNLQHPDNDTETWPPRE